MIKLQPINLETFEAFRETRLRACRLRACGIIARPMQEVRTDRVHIDSMWVAPDCRRLAVGRMLVTAVLDWARNRGAASARLDVTSDNERTKAFDQRLRVCFTGNVGPYPNDPKPIVLETMRGL